MVIKIEKKTKQLEKRETGGPIVAPQPADGSIVCKERSPVRRCDTCAYSGVCTFNKEGYECAFQDLFDNISIDSQEDVTKAMKELTSILVERAVFASMMERVGGGLSEETAQSMDLALRHLTALKAPERQEQQAPTSILAQFFQGGAPPKLEVVSVKDMFKKDEDVIDAEVTENKSEEST